MVERFWGEFRDLEFISFMTSSQRSFRMRLNQRREEVWMPCCSFIRMFWRRDWSESLVSFLMVSVITCVSIVLRTQFIVSMSFA